jgi:hypothetical protein
LKVARVAVPDLVSNSYFPAIAAIELGFFKQEGLDVAHELIFPNYKAYEALRDERPQHRRRLRHDRGPGCEPS